MNDLTFLLTGQPAPVPTARIIRADDDETQVCDECLEEKHIKYFYTKPSGWIDRLCRKCRNASQRAIKQAQKERETDRASQGGVRIGSTYAAANTRLAVRQWVVVGFTPEKAHMIGLDESSRVVSLQTAYLSRLAKLKFMGMTKWATE